VNWAEWSRQPGLWGFCGLVIGMLLALSFERFQLKKARRLRAEERAEADKALARSKEEIDALARQLFEHTEVFQFLPDHLRALLLAQGQRAVGPLALALIERLFHPEQSAVFVARPSRKKLALAIGSGLPASVPVGSEVDYGHGRLGWAAESHVAIDEMDFATARGEKTSKALARAKALEEPGLRGLRVDAVAPILEGNELLGVLCLGGARTRKGQEKKLLALAAELAAVSFTQSTRLKAAEEAEAMDGLTGVYNKRHFLDRLQAEMQTAAREEKPLSVLFLDLDHFEHYNRTNGHLAGDDVLRKLALMLKGAVRDTDVVGRVGGEEFAVVYMGANKELAMRLSESLRQSIEAFPFPNRQHQPLGAITISGGVSTFPDDSKKAEFLLRCADQALYEAKAAGRNRIFPGEPNFLA
jgi:diguanylate cyclase (GGDEF)-like protein